MQSGEAEAYAVSPEMFERVGILFPKESVKRYPHYSIRSIEVD